MKKPGMGAEEFVIPNSDYLCRMHPFSKKLITWYRKYYRDLPWRRTKDPYKIWISEIILQQTRVEQGLAYYKRFIRVFPDVKKLAAAKEQEVLNLWQGLGYYTRARNLHLASRQIVNEFNGKFPGSYDEIISLKGIGEYTAAAIGSISFQLPCPVVDGNVIRFFSRYFGIRGKSGSREAGRRIYGKAEEMITGTSPGEFNQAVMEFGALYCRPVNPGCERCIFRKECYAFLNGMVSRLPVKQEKTKQKTRYFQYLFIREKNNNHIYLKKRDEKDIWSGLYDFPLIESSKPLAQKALIGTDVWHAVFGDVPFRIKARPQVYKHILSHQVIMARFYSVEIERPLKKKNILRISQGELAKYPLPRLISRFLEQQPETV